jgi:hypothetical protein
MGTVDARDNPIRGVHVRRLCAISIDTDWTWHIRNINTGKRHE